MTPKEKAEDLVHQCRLILLQSNSELSHEINLTIYAKQFALFAVNEIIKSQPSYPMAWNLGIEINGLVDNAIFPFNYWKEVKQEIENL